MFTNAIFNLSGIGYLHDVIRKDDGVYAKINVIHRFNAGAQHSDDIWIDCIVKDDGLLRVIGDLEYSLRKQKTVILQYDIQYLGFDYCQNGMSEDDPKYIVFLKGKLQRVESYFINGESFNETQTTQRMLANSAIK